MDLFAGIGYYTLPLLVHAGQQLSLTLFKFESMAKPGFFTAAHHIHIVQRMKSRHTCLAQAVPCNAFRQLAPIEFYLLTESEKSGLAGAQHVFACEWNPAAAQALKHNLQRNGVAERCIVLEGNCTSLAPQVIWRQLCFQEIYCTKDFTHMTLQHATHLCKVFALLESFDTILVATLEFAGAVLKTGELRPWAMTWSIT